MLSRRSLLAASAGLAVAPRLSLAQPAPTLEKASVVLVWMAGSYNALFSAADAYVPNGFFGCTSSNVRDLGNGLVVDRSTLGSLSDLALSKLATVGVAHGYSDHISGPRQFFMKDSASYPLMLADAINGPGALRCVRFGTPLPGTHEAYAGVSMTSVPDLAAAVALAGGAATGPRPDLMARALRTSLEMSKQRFAQNPSSLSTPWAGTHTLINTLERPPAEPVDWSELSAAYGIATADTSARTFTSHLAGAELMVRAGADVVCVRINGWDTHGDGDGVDSRARFAAEMLPGLRTFLDRTLAMQGRNVVTVLFGEFARTGGKPTGDSGHANGTSASVFGKYVRPGTTGRPTVLPVGAGSASYRLPMGTPKTPGFWAYLAAVARAQKVPFGANPHAALM
ncbi:MAG: DUF1501 domain-containing protein [Myxococcus sp.]|nr:DUF1501 domain-containing protein [Myxococcus sp.]